MDQTKFEAAPFEEISTEQRDSQQALNQIEDTITTLSQKLENETEPSEDFLRSIAQEANKAMESFNTFLKTISGDSATLTRLYPNRGKIRTTIAETSLNALKEIPFNNLSNHEKENLVESLAISKKLFLSSKDGGYYHFGFGQIYFGTPPEGVTLLKKVKDKTVTLTPKEEETAIKEANNTWKIHIKIDTETDRMQLLYQLAEINNELPQWKMKRFGKDFQNPRFSDFVIYPQNKKEIAKIINALRPIMDQQPIAQTEAAALPRYSSSTILTGISPIPGISFVQGDGNFKDYLKRTGGEEKLAKFYDPDTNYAFTI
jgi:hypothetical protein